MTGGEGRACPACGSRDLLAFFEGAPVPVFCNVQEPTRERALAVPRGAVRLAFCRACAHVFNLAYDPRLLAYGTAYENSLHFSGLFQDYARELARGLVERHDLRGRTIVEIGCGQGDFLRALCDLGGNRGFGFDPGYDPDRAAEPLPPGVTCRREPFSGRSMAGLPAFDLLCCRQVLEHLENPVGLLDTVREAIPQGRRPVVFFEVPDALFTLERGGIWDIIYEHHSYFTPRSLRILFASRGWRVLGSSSVYGGQFLTIEAEPGPAPGGAEGRPQVPARGEGEAAEGRPGGAATPSSGDPGELARMEARVRSFGDLYRRSTGEWRRRLARLHREGRRVVVWGAGSKGVTFLNVLGVGEEIRYVVDVNPRKHGRHVAGTGQQIVAPGFLRGYRPDAAIVMNRIYAAEIRGILERLHPGGGCRLLFA